MPSALETLVKILKLEQESGCQDKAVIGGLKSFASHWVNDAHAQARKPEHHALVDELAELLTAYGSITAPAERYEAVKYMLGRIMGRIPPRGGVSPQTAATVPEPATPAPPEPPTPPAQPPVEVAPRPEPPSRPPQQHPPREQP